MNMEMVFRLVFFLALASAFIISGIYRKKARDEGGVIERKAEGGLVLFLRMALALPLLASFLLYVFYPRALLWSMVELPIWLRAFFAFIALLCIPLIWWVFQSIGKNISETVLTKEDHELVKHGPYRWVRHPLYASTLLLFCCFSLIASSWFIFVYFMAAVILFRFVVIPAEEKRLIAVFGEEYLAYKDETGALMPKLIQEKK